MAIVFIDIRVASIKHKEPVEQDHIWYDVDSQKMIQLRGGSLAFKYQDGKINVSTEPLFKTTYKLSNTKSVIMKWVEDNKAEYKFEILDGGYGCVALKFDDLKQESLEDDLYAQRFEYQIIKNA